MASLIKLAEEDLRERIEQKIPKELMDNHRLQVLQQLHKRYADKDRSTQDKQGVLKLASIPEKTGKNSKEVFDYLKENYPEDCLQWVKGVDWKLQKEVPLSDIKMARRPGGAREQDKVKGIAQAVRDGKPMDPVVLVRLPNGVIKIADGYHRTLGFGHAGKKNIKAWIANVTESKGAWDKEMHEKKLNVGKKATEVGIVGLGFQKEASLLGLLGLGTAMHVAPNLAMKAVKSTETGQKALTGMFSAGVDMGRTGKKLHPNAQSAMQYGIGPESIVDYQLGKSLGKRISHMPPEKQERFINKSRGMMNAHINRNYADKANELEKVPVLGSVKHYLDGKGENKVKDLFMKMSVPEEQKVTWKNRAADVAALGAAGAIDPHILIQPALSGVRKKVAESPIGGKIFEKGFKNGNEGVQISKPKEAAIDMFVSPSVLDPYRMGKAMKDHLPTQANDYVKENLDIGKIYKGISG